MDPAIVREYKLLDLNSSDLLLDIQGEALIIEDKWDISKLMKAFVQIKKFCPEAIFKLANGEKIQIFKHDSVELLDDPLLVKFNLKTSFPEIEKIEEVKIKMDDYLPKGVELEAYDLQMIIDSIKREIKPAKKYILEGDKPTILFLAIQYLLPLNAEIYYQENGNEEREKIN